MFALNEPPFMGVGGQKQKRHGGWGLTQKRDRGLAAKREGEEQ
jgi:hypothetical protein